jgi:predicted Zn-dependent peptidase
VRAHGVTPAELERAKHQLRARLVFESDSGTNIAHQLGYFRTIADVDLYHRSWSAIAGVTLDAVARVAASRLRATNRTVGWFKPVTTPGGPERQ